MNAVVSVRGAYSPARHPRPATQRAMSAGLTLALSAAVRLPEWLVLARAERAIMEGIQHKEGARFLCKALRHLFHRWPDFAPEVRSRFVDNIFLNAMVRSRPRRQRTAAVLGATPMVMVISPTMRCNLKCTGCYSANYSRQDVIDTPTFLRVLDEARELGIHFVVVSGGEPFLRKDLLGVVEQNPDLTFMAYTNGTIIADQNLAPRLARLGNFIPCISVEGFDEETDRRRGKGTFRKIVAAMGQLRSEGVMFGFSATPMRENNEILVSDEFVRFYRNLGCFVGWYFSYMPVGRDPDLSLMPTPEQRLYRADRVRELREHFDLLLADFWCDGELVGGCLSGGRTYFHINAQGGVEPCVFQQYSVDNILEKPLLEALGSAYFRDMREKLATIHDRARPCPVIDHPHLLRDSVRRFQPRISQSGGTKTIEELASGLDAYAKELERLVQERRAREGTC